MQGSLPALRAGGDADAVYRKATSLDPTRRYDSAAAFADDLERLAAGRPVSATPPSLRYTAWLFARRHPWSTTLGSLAAVLVMALGGLAAIGFVSASHERDAALLAEQRAREASLFLRNMLSSPDPDADGPDVRVADLLERAGRQIDDFHADDPLVALDLHRTIGWTYAALSQHAEAVPHLRSAVALGAEQLGPTSPEVLELETTLADSLVYIDELAQARRMMERVVETCKATPGVPSGVYAAALTVFAEVLRSLGETDKGIEMLHEARALALQFADPTSPEHRAVLSTLGRSYLELTLAEDARQVFEELVAQFSPDEKGRTASWFTARGNLAIALATEGRHSEAIPLYEEVLTEGPAVLGDMHHSVRMVRQVLADSYLAEDRPDDALAISTRSLQDAATVHGRGHPDELGALSNHAVLLMQLGRSEEALAFTERLAAETPAALGETHPRTLVALRNHAAALDNVGRDSESAALLYDILAIQQETLGDGYFDTMVTKNNLAFLLESIGRSQEAADLMQSVLDHAGPESGMPDAARAIFNLNLARSLVSLGEVERAAGVLRLARELNPEAASHLEKVRDLEQRLAAMRE